MRPCSIALFQTRHLAYLGRRWFVFAEDPAANLPAEEAEQEEADDDEDDDQDLCQQGERAPAREEVADDGDAEAGDTGADEQTHAEAETAAERTAVDIAARLRWELRWGRARFGRQRFLYRLLCFLAGVCFGPVVFGVGWEYGWGHSGLLSRFLR